MVSRFAAVCGLALIGGPLAEASTVLSSSRLAIGLNDDGSLVTDDRSLGILYDPSGGGMGDPTGSDMILPGYPFETWTADWSGGDQTNGGPHLNGGKDLSWEAPYDTGTVNGVVGTGQIGPLDVTMVYDLPWDLDILWIEVTVTARRDVSGLWLSRTVDPDLDATFGTYDSVNVAQDNIVSSSAQYSGRAMALAAEGGIGGICNNWCTDADDVVAGADQSETEDRVVGVAVDVGDLKEGETFTVLFAYGFGVDGDEATDLAEWGLEFLDRDGDGVTEEEGDCDDRDPWVYPDSIEYPDGIDNNCDGTIDEGTAVFDDDGDGFTEEDGDCDDADERVYPGAEPVEDVADADCDGEADDGDWSRVEEKPEGWGEDPEPQVEVVSGGCSALGVTGTTWAGVLLFMAFRRRGGEA